MQTKDLHKLLSIIQSMAESDPVALNSLWDAALQHEGIAKSLKGKLRPLSENPQSNWEKLMYTPTRFSKGKDGKELTDEEKRRQVWRGIQLRNIGGDIATGVGGTVGALANAASQAIKNTGDLSASQRQVDLYGATPSQRAAAAASPFMRSIGNISEILSGITANRLYQSAAERRASYLQSLMDSEYNNLGKVPGMYADARRKLGDKLDDSGVKK